jgi:hypothetical protein
MESKVLREVPERQPGLWTLERTLVLLSQRALAAFNRENGARLHLFYNQSEFEPGPVGEGSRYYLGRNGRMRSDLMLNVTLPCGSRRVRGTAGAPRNGNEVIAVD